MTMGTNKNQLTLYIFQKRWSSLPAFLDGKVDSEWYHVRSVSCLRSWSLWWCYQLHLFLDIWFTGHNSSQRTSCVTTPMTPSDCSGANVVPLSLLEMTAKRIPRWKGRLPWWLLVARMPTESLKSRLSSWLLFTRMPLKIKKSFVCLTSFCSNA